MDARQLKCDLSPGLVTEAAGSAYVEAGRTKVLCAVYGPKPTPPSAPFNAKARLNVEVKFAPFASGVRRFVPGKQSLVPSLLLETMPKSQIDLFVTVLESDGWDGDLSIWNRHARNRHKLLCAYGKVF
ncbi:hypothetical protein Rhopal_004356-T1 [Rhodotorula paludigena]|uniref:Exoribonuclease phosphorolytic domain-containing protein n=1 Tax=Rhodotorula paludigena TaxID=86838 RepID=A0AAV5GP86_9BASI|nr:hypothetical protein Rhopal_004356-T1 [Rhodotorula paludigena]